MTAGRFVDYLGLRLFLPHGHFDEPVLTAGGMPETHLMLLFERLGLAGRTVLDIGANIGTHTLKLSTLVGPRGRIYAVEADIDNAAAIRNTLRENELCNVDLFAVAASDRIEVLRAAESRQTNTVFTDTAGQDVSKTAAALPIDALLHGDVDLVKIDIEGAELKALRGIESLIRRCRPPILVEFSPAYIRRTLGADRSLELLRFFADRGYSCFHLDFACRMQPLQTAQDVLDRAASEERDFGWNHIDLFFVPMENTHPRDLATLTKPLRAPDCACHALVM